MIYPSFSTSDDNLRFLQLMIYPSLSPTDDLSLSFAAAATAPTQRDPNAEGQSITCAVCSSHPGLGHHNNNDDHHYHPDVSDDETVVHMSCHVDPKQKANPFPLSAMCCMQSPYWSWL